MNASMGAGAAALKAEWTAFLAKNKVTGLSMPLTDRWQLKDLAAKKLFYWSNRFSSYSSAAAFARATAALETATVKGLPIYVNFNNFAGRGYLKAISCFSPRICSRTLMYSDSPEGGSEHPIGVLSGDGSLLLLFMLTAGGSSDDVIAF